MGEQRQRKDGFVDLQNHFEFIFDFHDGSKTYKYKFYYSIFDCHELNVVLIEPDLRCC